MNNKGFTLVEVLAVVAILALIGTLTAPSVLKSLDLGKKTSDDVLINNIRVALQTMYEEGYYGNTEFYQYNLSGVTATKFGVTDSTDSITVNLQTLVGNGFLTGVNNEISASCSGTTNCNKKVILNSEGEDLGMCSFKLTKFSGNKVCYKIEKVSGDSICPTTDDFGGNTQCS